MPVHFFAPSPGITVALMIWAIGVGLILIDLYRLYHKRQRGEAFSWFGSPLLWFSACAFPIGLMITAVVASLSLAGSFGLLFAVSVLLLLFFLVGGLIAVVRWDTRQIEIKQETLIRQQAESNPRYVAPSRSIGHLTIMGVMIIGLMSSFYLLADILQIFIGQYHSDTWLIVSAFIALWFIGIFAVIIPFSIAYKRFYKRLNARKSSLAAENRWFRMHGRTVQEPLQTVMPPLVLRLKWIFIFCYPLLIAAYGCVLWSFYTTPNHISVIIQILIYSPIFLFYLLRDWGERVEVTTQDLTVARGIWFAQQKQHLPWQEARLFVCYQAFSLSKRKTIMVYELIGSARLVQWTRIIDTRSLFMPWKSTLPGEEYTRRTQELCAFITRQTGLPLLDLSEERPNTLKQEILIESQLQK